MCIFFGNRIVLLIEIQNNTEFVACVEIGQVEYTMHQSRIRTHLVVVEVRWITQASSRLRMLR